MPGRKRKFNKILKNVISRNIFDYLILSFYELFYLSTHTSREDIRNETASGGMHPISVQNRVIYLPFVKSVSIMGYFRRD